METKNKITCTVTRLSIYILLLINNFAFSQNSFYSELTSGFSTPLGNFKNFSENGFNVGFTINKNYCNNISLSFGANYNSLEINNTVAFSNKRWNNLSFFTGPQYNIKVSSFSFQIYSRLGMSFIEIPEIKTFFNNSNVVITEFKEENTNAFNSRFGLNIKTKICNGLDIFFNSEYSTSLNGKIKYTNRDVSKAVLQDGSIDSDFANSIPFNNNSFNFSTINFNIGLSIDLNCGSTNSTRVTDYNSSRSNKSEKSGIDTNNNNQNITKATDYNSSRSNKSFGKPNDLDKNEDNPTNRATDYNSSRSNKSEKSGIDTNNNNYIKGNKNLSSSQSLTSNLSKKLNLDTYQFNRVMRLYLELLNSSVVLSKNKNISTNQKNFELDKLLQKFDTKITPLLNKKQKINYRKNLNKTKKRRAKIKQKIQESW